MLYTNHITSYTIFMEMFFFEKIFKNTEFRRDWIRISDLLLRNLVL